MAERLDGDDFAAMVNAAADVIDANAGALSRLDAVNGDGDHGANAQRALTQARSVACQLDDPSPASVLEAVADACGETMAGASGAVFAAFFAGAARSIGDHSTVDALALAGMLAAGLQRVRARRRCRCWRQVDRRRPRTRRRRCESDSRAHIRRGVGAGGGGDRGARRCEGDDEHGGQGGPCPLRRVRWPRLRRPRRRDDRLVAGVVGRGDQRTSALRSRGEQPRSLGVSPGARDRS